MDELSERRAHVRRPVTFFVRCQRLGPRQTEVPDEVRVVDLSLGGLRVVAPPWAAVGNVVEVELDGVGVRSLVVALSPAARPDDEAHAHLAFGSLMPEAIGVVSRRLEGPVEVR